MEAEAVLCEVVNSWVTSDWFCCPHACGVLSCFHKKESNCARKRWPQGKRHPIRPSCLNDYGSQPELVCDNCSWASECVRGTLI